MLTFLSYSSKISMNYSKNMDSAINKFGSESRLYQFNNCMFLGSKLPKHVKPLFPNPHSVENKIHALWLLTRISSINK